jgi:outer membrane protein assembly factor BamB
MRKLVSLVAFLSITACACAADWPQWLGPNRDGSSAEIVKSWKGALNVLWKAPVAAGHGGPVVSNGVVYLHCAGASKFEEALCAFDAVTGELKWQSPYVRRNEFFEFGNCPRATPTVMDGKVYTFGVTGVLSCFNADKGKLLWQVDAAKAYDAPPPAFGFSCSPIVVDELVLINVGATGASIVAP